IEPVKSPVILWRISAGSAQLFVGPASSWRVEQIYVRSSTRATSLGCERARKLCGRSFSFKRVNVPCCSSASHIVRYSSALPSHQCTLDGVHSRAISSTQDASLRFDVGAD